MSLTAPRLNQVLCGLKKNPRSPCLLSVKTPIEESWDRLLFIFSWGLWKHQTFRSVLDTFKFLAKGSEIKTLRFLWHTYRFSHFTWVMCWSTYLYVIHFFIPSGLKTKTRISNKREQPWSALNSYSEYECYYFCLLSWMETVLFRACGWWFWYSVMIFQNNKNYSSKCEVTQFV